MFKKVTIVGVGLIGGSIGLALKKKKLARVVCGVGRRNSSIQKALKLKAIDTGTLDFKKGIKDADLIILATPVSLIKKYLRLIKNEAKQGCIVTDAGSTKSEIVSLAHKVLPRHVSFIGGHPMAGSEKRGVVFANSGLFKGSITILTKTQKTKVPSLKRIALMWKKIGADCKVLTPTQHDRIVAQVSHLPHIVACCLVNSTASAQEKFTAKGFKDTTRIASSDPAMWRDIILSNKSSIKAALKKFNSALKKMQARSEKNLLPELKKAKARRDRI